MSHPHIVGVVDQLSITLLANGVVVQVQSYCPPQAPLGWAELGWNFDELGWSLKP